MTSWNQISENILCNSEYYNRIYNGDTVFAKSNCQRNFVKNFIQKYNNFFTEYTQINFDNSGGKLVENIGTNHSHNTNTNATNSHNTNTVNANKTFNINMYLNEQCKNAIDIQDFVRTLGCSQDDLVENRHLDFTERVTKQIRDGFRNSTVEERPIHCSDAKRNTLHIRDNGEWISGNESKKKVWEIIKHLEHTYWGNFQRWFIENPECKILDTAAYEKYIKIYQSVLGPKPEMQDEKCLKKVMNIIADETAIDKTRCLA